MPPLSSFLETVPKDLFPQAEIEISPRVLEDRISLGYSHDDLDEYIGASFHLDGDFQVAIRRYSGFPSNVFVIYFERTSDMDVVRMRIKQILDALRIPASSLTWSRVDDPEA